MVNLAVVYYSSTGATYALAAASAAAAEKLGAEVRLRRVAELDPGAAAASRSGSSQHRTATEHVPVAEAADLDWADAILIGSPVHFGLAAPAVMQFINTTSALSVAGKLSTKVVSAFATASAPHGGQVSTILALHNAICHWGSIIIATGSTAGVLFKPHNGNPYGASSTGAVHEENLEAIEFQTERTIAVAAAVLRGGLEPVVAAAATTADETTVDTTAGTPAETA
ncbi:flavodoxin family protein [Actinokineospora globicatena]|uniref:flavodoxin family protein n=1 Tax=Actinokineospora globicatena TaxID=103729 RepID=UPI0020A539A7|nr:NAD(P)H-dependent oxidoreductase [Actinokineospora globicatena]MCP2303170.1 NAD(P)H dehydrogenase (quinone) [Actinokineospora globicatena]GLW79713.1 trp repressor-binding protein WrbA [Actinokineospora globicatena]GLW85877.1 trp repressor-binding protein WrbA [Actinokineospora globicatena]